MKYIVHHEYCPDNLEMVLEKNMKLTKDREKETDKHPRYLIPLQHTGQGNCFTIIETNDLNQYKNNIESLFSEEKIQYTPCNDIPEWIKLFIKCTPP